LEYEAYASMAEAMLRELSEEAVEKFGCLAVRVHHALGEVPPGEVSVFVQVVCGHRDMAFAACRFLIDELKAKAPIWKREQWDDGSTWSAGQVVAT
jgi:molybdopterin synthase catalytic subunit